MQAIPLYDLLELTYTHTTSRPNPFDVPVEAIFTHISGKTQVISGFHDGDDAYRVRFMPTEVGGWTYTTFIDGVMTDRGSMTCAPSESHGPLMQDPAHPYHFIFANGEPIYMMGNTAYRAITAYKNTPDKFCEFLDYYAARRFNWLRFQVAGGKPHYKAEETLENNWAFGGDVDHPDFTVFDLPYFRAAEGVVRELGKRGMIASVIILSDKALEQAGADRLPAAQRTIAYTIARLGAYANVVWCLFNEWNKFAIFDYPEVDQLGFYLHTHDPYQRLTSIHHYARFEFYEKVWTDMSSLQHRGLPGEINRVIQQNRLFNKIVINEEYGYEADTLRPPNDPDNVRHDHWAIAVAGGYASYGDKTKGPKIGAYFTALLDDMRGTVVPDMLQRLHAFMSQTGYRQMSPGNAYLSECSADEVFCLVNPGREYIVYLTRGQHFRLNLAHVRGAVSVTWYDPRMGTYHPAATLAVTQLMNQLPQWDTGDRSWLNMHLNHNMEFTPPDMENDWVLHLKAVEG
jgi:hypothetical protein